MAQNTLMGFLSQIRARVLTWIEDRLGEPIDVITITDTLDLIETTTPTPIADTARVFAEDQNGNTRVAVLFPDGSLEVLSRDNVIIIRNMSGTALAPGEAVYVSGSTGNIPNVDRARSDSETTMPALGLVFETIADGGFGRLMVSGRLNFDTSDWPDGTKLFVSSTVAGELTSTAPSHPNLRQRVGIVLNQGVGNGQMLVGPFIVRGDHEGTNQNQWLVGNNATGAKDIVFRNGNDLTLRANPSGARVVTIPDTTATLESQDNKAAASGYASLDGTTKVPTAQLGTGVADSTVFLRGDRTWSTPSGGSGDSITVNGISVTDADFDNSTPAAPAGGVNVKWQQDGGTPANISANLAANDVSNTVLRDSGALSVIGRSANSSGDPADISASAASGAVLRESGSVLGFGTIATAGITNDAVDNTKISDMAQSTIKGRAVGGGTGDPQDLTATQATAILDTFTSGLKGLAPASGGGTTNFLRADGTWTTPSGSGPSTTKATGDTSTTSNTVLSNATGLSFSVTSGTYYTFEFRVLFRTAANTTGIALSLSIPTFTTFGATAQIPAAADGTAGEYQGWITSSGDTVVATGVQTANTDYVAIVSGTILPTANGTIQLQFRSEVSGSNVTVRQGSAGILHNLGT